MKTLLVCYFQMQMSRSRTFSGVIGGLSTEIIRLKPDGAVNRRIRRIYRLSVKLRLFTLETRLSPSCTDGDEPRVCFLRLSEQGNR